MELRPDEITSILKGRIEGLGAGEADLSEVGTVLSVADGIARIHGLEHALSFELLELPHAVTGLALNLESDTVGAVLFGCRTRRSSSPSSASSATSLRSSTRPVRRACRRE